MDIVFFGTSEFAIPSLKKLVSSKHKVLAVVTRPDKRKGRSLKISSPPVKEAAIKLGIRKILQPVGLEESFIKTIKNLKADLFVVIAYSHILKEEILKIPSFYSINLHPSLLPSLRGAAPINWALLNGDTETGVTVIKLNEKMDEGDIISQKKIGIEKDDTAISLTERLSEAGAELLAETIRRIEEKKEKFIKQDSREATYARKLTKRDGLIDWTKSAAEIHNKVRAFIPWPGAYTETNLKIWKTKILDEGSGTPGKIIEAKGDDLIIQAGLGRLKILELQLEGGKRMDAASFLRGHNPLEFFSYP